MKIVAVSNIKNEADIIQATVLNLIKHGVDEIITTDGMSTDGTRDILADLRKFIPIKIIDDPEERHHQHKLMNMVVQKAVDHHADWIIPFDADEFWYAEQHPTIREALESTDAFVLKAALFQYFDYTHREPNPKTFPKVCFRRPVGTFDLAMGSHNINLEVGGPEANSLVAIREVQFRGFDHFVWKVRQRAAAFPDDVPIGNGAHVRSWAAMTDEQLAQEWTRMEAQATVEDPVPTTLRNLPAWSAP